MNRFQMGDMVFATQDIYSEALEETGERLSPALPPKPYWPRRARAASSSTSATPRRCRMRRSTSCASSWMRPAHSPSRSAAWRTN